MTSPLAVLLIIGAATVGPIEAQPTVDVDHLPGGYGVSGLDDPRTALGRATYPPGYIARVENCKATHPWNTFQCMAYVSNNEDGVELETLPQLCERALREIGADSILRVSEDRVQSREYFFVTKEATYPALREITPVRCIPVPEGFRGGK